MECFLFNYQFVALIIAFILPSNKPKLHLHSFCRGNFGLREESLSVTAAHMTKKVLHTKRVADLTGRRFGKLTALRLLRFDSTNRKAIWECVCECGRIKKVRSDALLLEKVKSCGCRLKTVMSANRDDLTGKRFGMLTVVKYIGVTDKNRSPIYMCQCDCGKIKEVRGYNLTGGRTSSCGCKRFKRPSSMAVKKN